jgi:GDP-L-fucose synthase
MLKGKACLRGGHEGLIGWAVLRLMQSRGYEHLVSRGHGDLERTDPKAMTQFFQEERPEVVALAAGRVGSIVLFNKASGWNWSGKW